jgi:hypothetical protein
MNILLPVLLRIQIARAPRGGFRLWFPLVLFWPLWLVFLGLFLATALVATAITGTFAFGSAIAATRELHFVAAALRGAQCELEAKSGRQLFLSFV